ncbi:hypothetical protein RRG08_052421 [Elysia crispata]|uniref:Uncharacterized protein n=1 Tax=Elysia crispata TaxID=231223 RepID=A0AAE1E871_9GAST|nr:hypothetical protein RRG08_052421 [Elysia crispata]
MGNGHALMVGASPRYGESTSSIFTSDTILSPMGHHKTFQVLEIASLRDEKQINKLDHVSPKTQPPHYAAPIENWSTGNSSISLKTSTVHTWSGTRSNFTEHRVEHLAWDLSNSEHVLLRQDGRGEKIRVCNNPSDEEKDAGASPKRWSPPSGPQSRYLTATAAAASAGRLPLGVDTLHSGLRQSTLAGGDFVVLSWARLNDDRLARNRATSPPP